MSQRHEGLVVWQRADDLCVRIYRLTHEHFPRDERFGLSAQVRRAAYSVAANIVEGYADASNKWRIRYLRIALASLAEVGYALHLARRLEYLTESDYSAIEKQVRGTAAPLHGLVNSLRTSARQ
jgi:four helix bundle protein